MRAAGVRGEGAIRFDTDGLDMAQGVTDPINELLNCPGNRSGANCATLPDGQPHPWNKEHESRLALEAPRSSFIQIEPGSVPQSVQEISDHTDGGPLRESGQSTSDEVLFLEAGQFGLGQCIRPRLESGGELAQPPMGALAPGTQQARPRGGSRLGLRTRVEKRAVVAVGAENGGGTPLDLAQHTPLPRTGRKVVAPPPRWATAFLVLRGSGRRCADGKPGTTSGQRNVSDEWLPFGKRPNLLSQNRW